MEAAEKFRKIALSDPAKIRDRYSDRPIAMMRLIDPSLRFPYKIRVLFAMLWKRQDLDGNPASRFIIKGPRGGGKTKFMGAFGFAEWFLRVRDMVVLGGSLSQAQNVYNYFTSHVYAQEAIVDSLPAEPTMGKTETDQGNYFKAVAASPKAVRGPHPHDLLIDEACEAKDEIIDSALPMVASSENPLVVMTSTFHKIFGKFQEVWDAAPEIGWVRYSWDVFDVTKSFDPAIWSDEQLMREVHDLSILQAGENSLEFRAQGRTGDPEGWFDIRSVIQSWREKSSLDWFDVELMGLRPSAVGMVNKPEDVDACIFAVDEPKTEDEVPVLPVEYRHDKNLSAAGGIDWGFSGMTSVTGYHKGRDDLKINHYQREYTGTRSHVIIEDTLDAIEKFNWRVVYCDISHKFENADLAAAIAKKFQDSEFRCRVVEVAFVKEKSGMLGNYRAHFQRRLLRIPSLAKFKPAVWQHKRYRYQLNSDKPLKQDDHIPDSTMLCLSHWPLGKVASKLPKQNFEKDRSEPDTFTGGLMEMDF